MTDTDATAQCGRTYPHPTHLTDNGPCYGLLKQTPPPAADPWRERPTYEQLVLGLRVIASDADVRGDHHVAAYAHLALAGEPFPVDTDDDDDTPDEDRAPVVYAGDRRTVEFSVKALPDTGVLLLPGHGPEGGSLTADATPAVGTVTKSDAERIIEQVRLDRGSPYWSGDRQGILDGVTLWAESLRDHLDGAPSPDDHCATCQCRGTVCQDDAECFRPWRHSGKHGPRREDDPS